MIDGLRLAMSHADRSAENAPKPATPQTRRANEAVRAALPFDDEADFADAARGLIGTIPDGQIPAGSGGFVWNARAWQFLDSPEAPPSVNPSLWRIARLNRQHGLFKVTDRVYQVRGYDLANMTIIEGDTGAIIIDPLMVAESARAALALYHAHRPERPVRAVIYSHSHVDHYGGVGGVIDEQEAATGRVQVIAPDGFLEAVGGENVLAGNVMGRRAQFQFGTLLPPGPGGHVDVGLGKAIARGRTGLIAPNLSIVEPVETHLVDGVEIVFQLAPGTEAPAEMHLFTPQFSVLNMAENATRHLHNFCPLRGALVRDPRLWSFYLAKAVELFGDRTEILIGQHHWPTWGRDRIHRFLAQQRDLYKFIHDQTVRLMNHGLKPTEIAEALDLPPELQREWSVRGYYGTVSHNAKAVYQRYLSWYDGNPANLHPLPPRQSATRTIDYMGGANAVLTRAREDFAAGEYRWVAQVASQLVHADPGNREARALAADAFEQLGYQAESGTWRNAYLYGAQEMRHGTTPLPPRPMISPDILVAVGTGTLFDFMAVRLNPARVAGRSFVLNWQITPTGESIAQTLAHSTLSQLEDRQLANADATIQISRSDLVSLILRQQTVSEALAAGRLQVQGDSSAVIALFDMLDDFTMQFAVVEPLPHDVR